MPNPMRIRASIKGERVEVKILMSHEMETGQRKDADGTLVPAWFIQRVTVRCNERTVLSAQWGTGVAKNPYLQFEFAGGKAGDTIVVEWTDNKGESRSDSARVS